MNWFQKTYWRQLSKPASDRPLWSFLLERPINSALLVGMGDGLQTKNLLQLVQRDDPSVVFRLAAIDLFESAVAGSGHLRLKDAHRLCAVAGVKAHLIPGELKSALPRTAVTVLPSDLVICNYRFEKDSVEHQTWLNWLPRLVHANSTVLAISTATNRLELVDCKAVAQTRKAA